MKSNIYSRKRRLNHLYKVIDKKWQEVTFKPNTVQKLLMDKELEIKKESNWRIRLMILKSRQLWMTTYKCIDKLDRCLFYDNVNANIVAHNKEKLIEIFQKVKFAYERLPNEIQLIDWKTRKKPQAKYDNKNELFFKKKNSKIMITLDSRSGTLSDLHVSELAFIDKAKEMMRWTLPSAEFADITIETTANWMNFFKYFWDNNTQFQRIFFPRYLDENYRTPTKDNFYIIDDLSYLKDELNLDDDQINRYQIKYLDDKDWTLQEYPTRPIDAFISSWSAYYNLVKLRKLKPITWTPDYLHKELTRYNKKPNKDVLIWIDLAEWLDHGDYTVIRIRDRELKLIASYKSNKIEPGDATNIVNYIYNLWFRWVIAPERNNHWHTFLYAAKQYVRYKDIYIPKKDRNDVDMIQQWQRGWHTNVRTRPLMLDEHKQAINDGIIEVDQDLIEECYTFIVKNSKPQAEENCNDDIVIADAICLQMLKERSMIREEATIDEMEY